MKVAWLADTGNADGTIGGAELTQREFRTAKPKGVKTVTVQPDRLELVRDCDAVCVFNCVGYPDATIRALSGKRVVRYFNDVAPHGSPDLTLWLLSNATAVFTSPLHMQRFPWINGHKPDHRLIPPPVPLERFRSAQNAAERRTGAVALGPWMNPGKSPHRAAEWAREAGVQIDYFGGGPFAPPGSMPIEYDHVPELFAKYRTFVHLPSVLEPFGRTVVEAWAAGCELVINGLVGARYWIEEQPDRLETAAGDFWDVVTREE